MVKVIQIYNPNNIPFGKLSNNATHLMTIERKTYPTVTNYILSQMMITPIYRQTLSTARITADTRRTVVRDKVNQIIANTEAKEKRFLSLDERLAVQRQVEKDVMMAKKNIYELYDYYLGQEHFSTVLRAVEKAYTSLVMERDDLRKTLLSTDNKPIIYISPNELLGIGNSMMGSNLVGKVLMQIRDNLRRSQSIQIQEENRANTENTIFNVYKAYLLLRNELKKGNDLKSFLGQSSEQILTNLDERTLDIHPGTKKVVLDLYSKGYYPMLKEEIENPGRLVILMRKEGLEELVIELREKRKDIILNTYTEYIIRKERPQMPEKDVKKAASQLRFSNPGDDKAYTDLKNKVMDLYERNKFPSEINAVIRESISSITIPTEKELEEATSSDAGSSSSSNDDEIKQIFNEDEEKAEKARLIALITKRTGKNKKVYKKYSLSELQEALQIAPEEVKEESKEPQDRFGSQIEIFPEQNAEALAPFSPLFQQELMVDNLRFTRISDYISTMLLTLTGKHLNKNLQENTFRRGTDIIEARKLLIENENPLTFVQPNQASVLFETRLRETFEELLSTFSRIALNKKFENASLRSLLALTGKAVLIWADPHDIYLGNYNGKGMNVVGNQLMKLREDIQIDQVELRPIIDSVQSFMIKDDFMRDWLGMRIRELCQTVNKFAQYILILQKKRIIIDGEFTKNVIFSIYEPCVPFVEELKEHNPPKYVLAEITDCSLTNPLTRDYDLEIANMETERTRQYDAMSNAKKMREFEAKQKEEFFKLQSKLAKSKQSTKKKTEALERFNALQRNAKEEFQRVLAEESRRSEKAIRDIDRAIVIVEKERKEELAKRQEHRKEMSRVVWNHLSAMVLYLIQHMEAKDEQNVKKVITSMELMNSEPTECNVQLNNDRDSCIASALFNVLAGIMKFNELEQTGMSLGRHDIDLAHSIILGFTTKKVMENAVDVDNLNNRLIRAAEDGNIERVQKLLLKGANDINAALRVASNTEVVKLLAEQSIENEVRLQDDDYEEKQYTEPNEEIEEDGEEEVDYGEVDERGDSAEFGMQRIQRKKRKHFPEGEIIDELELVKNMLRPLMKEDDENKLIQTAQYFLKTISDIRNSNMPNRVKTNRINFFATIR